MQVAYCTYVINQEDKKYKDFTIVFFQLKNKG